MKQKAPPKNWRGFLNKKCSNVPPFNQQAAFQPSGKRISGQAI
jgi:hypothetical protein